MEYVLFFLLPVLFFLGYPFFVYMIASSATRQRLLELEGDTCALKEALHGLQLNGAQARSAQAAPAAEATPPPKPTVEPAPVPEPRRAQAAASDAPGADPIQTPLPVQTRAPIAGSLAPPDAPTQAPPSPVPRLEPAHQVAPPPAWLVAVKGWLFAGNLVAKIGLLILFIGVSFLLKYAAERVTVPIEVRLTGIVLADLVLLVWGWRMRLTRRNLSLPIQGAALAILMLVTFGAFRMYELIPAGLAFGLLFVLTTFTCLLAVMQNALWLAVFGITGGFLAPIMTSTGQGSHIALFSYYAVLNAGILAIALKRTWRALNLLGFAFTFAIGTAWGVLRYSADQHYLSSQLFLILFFLFYVAIALLYATRQATQLKNYVDATLVFGAPLAAFGLQLGLMRGVEFGNAFSALGLGLFYIALALSMWNKRGNGLKLLVESSLALGIVFATLALPFALDARWTSAAWALEGAGVVWVGLRQKQRLTWMFGLLVQGGAWISFIGALSGMNPDAARESNLWLGFLMLAASAFFMATSFRKHGESDGAAGFSSFSTAFLAGASLWFMAGAWTEIVLHNSGASMANLLAASGLATAAILTAIGARMQWKQSHIFALAAQMVAGATLLVIVATRWNWSEPAASLWDRPVLGALLICAGALFTSWNMWRTPDSPVLAQASRMVLAWSAFWWFGPILNTVSGCLVLHNDSLSSAPSLTHSWWSVYGVCVAASALPFTLLAKRLGWANLRWLGAAAWPALAAGVAIVLAVLYGDGLMPPAAMWIALAALWLVSEWMLGFWPAQGWNIAPVACRAIHIVRIAGPWIMLWKVGEVFISQWLFGAPQTRQLLADGGWQVNGSWANFLPAWAMMLVLAWLITRSSSQRWPLAPLAGWYRSTLLPLATAWSVLLMGLWNLRQDGAMEPLPYLPLLNPLDLSTGFAILLGMHYYRAVRADSDRPGFIDHLPLLAAIGAYVWLNLILLRSASHYLGIAYRFDAMFASQFIQAMLSLVWSVTALVLMRHAARSDSPVRWMAGAGFLGLVVAKLFLVDLSSVGSVARIVSFVGVGLLMVLIGYLAPYPNNSDTDSQKASA